MSKLASVLLVDDDPTTNFLNKLLFNRLGMLEVLLVAENGADALAALAQVCTDAGGNCRSLILLDVNMPLMNGLKFLATYQQLPLPGPVVVLLTTSANPSGVLRQHFPVQFPTSY